MSNPKEPCYFDVDLPFPGSPRSDAEYMRCFKGATDAHLVVGEASTNYLYSRVAVQRALQFSPDARFIVMVRNPIDMSRSLHAYSVQELVEDIEEFEVAWRLQDRRRLGLSLPPVSYQRDFVLYGDFCRLGEQVSRLFKIVPRELVHVVIFDDLVLDPLRTYRNTLDFLGLPYDGRTDFDARNVTGVVRSRTLRRAMMQLLAWRQRIPVRRFGFGFFNRMIEFNLGNGPRRGLDPDFFAELAAYFRPDVELLSELLERDLTAWLKLPRAGSDRNDLRPMRNQTA